RPRTKNTSWQGGATPRDFRLRARPSHRGQRPDDHILDHLCRSPSTSARPHDFNRRTEADLLAAVKVNTRANLEWVNASQAASSTDDDTSLMGDRSGGFHASGVGSDSESDAGTAASRSFIISAAAPYRPRRAGRLSPVLWRGVARPQSPWPA